MTNVESMDYTHSHRSTIAILSNTAHLSPVSYTHHIPSSKQPPYTTKKDTSVTFCGEQKKLYHTNDTSMMIIVTKPGILIDVVGSYFYDKKS